MTRTRKAIATVALLLLMAPIAPFYFAHWAGIALSKSALWCARDRNWTGRIFDVGERVIAWGWRK